MGLDAVELVMAVEEKFGIEISDPEAEKVLTVGDLQRLVLSKLKIVDEKTCLTQQAFYRIRKTAIDLFNVSRNSFTPRTLLASFIPQQTRKEDWLRLQSALGVVGMPSLELPKTLSLVLVSAVLTPLVGIVWYGALTGSLGYASLVAIVVSVAIGWTGVRLTEKYRSEFSDGYSRVADVARFVVAKHPELLHRPRSKSWTPEEVRCLLREIIIEQLGIADFNDNSRFVADLHID